MAGETRNFFCKFNEALCDDGRCKLGFCASELDWVNAPHEPPNSIKPPSAPKVIRPRLSEDERTLRGEARLVAKEILKRHGRKLTKEVVEKVANHEYPEGRAKHRRFQDRGQQQSVATADAR